MNTSSLKNQKTQVWEEKKTTDSLNYDIRVTSHFMGLFAKRGTDRAREAAIFKEIDELSLIPWRVGFGIGIVNTNVNNLNQKKNSI